MIFTGTQIVNENVMSLRIHAKTAQEAMILATSKFSTKADEASWESSGAEGRKRLNTAFSIYSGGRQVDRVLTMIRLPKVLIVKKKEGQR